VHPFARSRDLLGQHPVQQDAISDRAAEAAQPRPHRGDHDARLLGQQRTELGDGALDRVDLTRPRARPDPEPQPRGIEPKAVHLRRDLLGRISMKRQHTHTEIGLAGDRGKLRKRVQTASSRLVV